MPYTPEGIPYSGESETTEVTSRAAAESQTEQAETCRTHVYQAILDAGLQGCTDDEIQDHLEMGSQTECPRRRELQQAGLVAESTKHRLTRKNRWAVVWVATKFMQTTEQT